MPPRGVPGPKSKVVDCSATTRPTTVHPIPLDRARRDDSNGIGCTVVGRAPEFTERFEGGGPRGGGCQGGHVTRCRGCARRPINSLPRRVLLRSARNRDHSVELGEGYPAVCSKPRWRGRSGVQGPGEVGWPRKSWRAGERGPSRCRRAYPALQGQAWCAAGQLPADFL